MKFFLKFLVGLFFFCPSCTSIASLYHNVNTNKKFGSKDEYLNFVSKDLRLTESRMYFPDSKDEQIIGSDITNKKLTFYYGIVKADHFTSADQMSIKGCQGQIVNLFKLFKVNSPELVITSCEDSDIFKKMKVDRSKTTLIFVYSYRAGKLSRRKISDVIKELAMNDDFDYRLVTLDTYDIK